MDILRYIHVLTYLDDLLMDAGVIDELTFINRMKYYEVTEEEAKFIWNKKVSELITETATD